MNHVRLKKMINTDPQYVINVLMTTYHITGDGTSIPMLVNQFVHDLIKNTCDLETKHNKTKEDKLTIGDNGLAIYRVELIENNPEELGDDKITKIIENTKSPHIYVLDKGNGVVPANNLDAKRLFNDLHS